MIIQTVYIFPGLSESAQMQSARDKVKNHPHGFSNVCFHKQGQTCNVKCFTLDINEKDEEIEV